MNGGWSQWGSFGSCNTNGKKKRARTCTNPTPLNGGKECPGSDNDEKACPGKKNSQTIYHCIGFQFQWMEDGPNGNLLDLATKMESNKEAEPVQTQHH